MDNNFDLKKFLIENRLTVNSRILFEEEPESKNPNDKPSPEDEEIIDDLGSIFAKIKSIDISPEDIPSNVKKKIQQEKGKVDEGIGGLVFGALLSLPKILEGIGWIIKAANKFIKSKRIENVGEWFKHNGHELHDKYKFAFEYLAKKLIAASTGEKNPSPQHVKLVANAIFIAVLGYALYGAIGTAAQLKGIISAVEAGLAGVKASELLPMSMNLVNSLKRII